MGRLPLMACAAPPGLSGGTGRPANPPIAQAGPNAGYRFGTRMAKADERGNPILALSCSEPLFLRRTGMVTAQAESIHLPDVADAASRPS